MRVGIGSSVAYSSAGPMTDSDATKTLFAEAATAGDLERRIQETFAEVLADQEPGDDWQLVFLDVAGGGYGHNFVAAMEFANDAAAGVTVTNGRSILSEDLFIALFEAADARELPQHEVLARRRADAHFAEAGESTFSLVQTAVSGASQGTKFFGAMVFAD